MGLGGVIDATSKTVVMGRQRGSKKKSRTLGGNIFPGFQLPPYGPHKINTSLFGNWQVCSLHMGNNSVCFPPSVPLETWVLLKREPRILYIISTKNKSKWKSILCIKYFNKRGRGRDTEEIMDNIDLYPMKFFNTESGPYWPPRSNSPKWTFF